MQKKRVNQIGESFSSPKQINEPERIALLRDHSKRKADELLEQQERKRAKRQAEDRVAVLRAYGYVKPGESAVSITAMKTFLWQNVQKVQIPRAATHAKRADYLDFLKALFQKLPSQQWVHAAVAQTPPPQGQTCCQAGCTLPGKAVLRQCTACQHSFHHICSSDEFGKVCKCCTKGSHAGPV